MSKEEADSLRRVEIWWLKDKGYLRGRSGLIEWTNSWYGTKSSIGVASVFENGTVSGINFNYTQTKDDGEKKSFNYTARITTTPCYFGGVRHWFICPLFKRSIACGRRVAILYKAGDWFGCRHCYELTYSSRNENHKGRFAALSKIFSIDAKIEKLEMKMKKRFYRGNATRKFKQVMKLYRSIGQYNEALPDLGKI